MRHCNRCISITLKKNASVIWCIILGSIFATAALGDDYSTWPNHQKIYLNTTALSLDSNVVNFPVLIRLTPATLNGYNLIMAGGVDIRFSKSDYSKHLSYQIESWNGSSGTIWVKVDTVYRNNSSQYIVMHYGKTTDDDSSQSNAVFDTANGFAGVWHLGEDGNSDPAGYKDATCNVNNGTGVSLTASSDTGIAGICGRFAGDSDYISIPNAASLNPSNITVSAWINPAVWSTGYTAVVSKQVPSSPYPSFDFRKNISSTSIEAAIAVGTNEYKLSGSAISTGAWQYITFTYDGNNLRIYNNGTQSDSAVIPSGVLAPCTSEMDIGRNSGTSTGKVDPRFFNGKIDEIEISKTARTPDWIKLSYRTQKPSQATVCFQPKVITQPKDSTVNLGDTVSFSIVAKGDSLKCQWQKSRNGATWDTLTGATGSSFKFKTGAIDTNAQYRCIVTSFSYKDTSETAALCILPKINKQTGDTEVVSGAQAFFSIGATGTSLSYQWQKQDKNSLTWKSISGSGATKKTYAYNPTVADSGAHFRCLVSGHCGKDTSNEAMLTVYGKVDAYFKMSDSIGPAPLTVDFTDSSSGSISKWRWYYGDGKSDSSTTPKKQVHQFDSVKVYTVKLVVRGAGGVDSMTRTVTVYSKEGNPILMTGRYLAPDSVELVLKNYDSLRTKVPTSFVSAIQVWSRGGAIPSDTVGSKLQKSYDLTALIARGGEYRDTVKVTPLPASDSLYGFMSRIVWNDSSRSPFAAINGFIVLMRDTVKPVNSLALSVGYSPWDTAKIYLDSLQKIDTLKTDSVGLWYGLGNDTVPNFESKTDAVKWWSVREILKSAQANRFIYVLKKDTFNSDQKTLTCAVVLSGKNHLRSAQVTASTKIGWIRPTNPIQLHATAVDPNCIHLTWNRLTALDSVERIRIYYRSGDTLPYDYDINRLKVDSVVPEPKSTDTEVTVLHLNEKSRYYFGAQVYKKGLWSCLTNASVAVDSTPEAGTSTTKNIITITKTVFDTATNEVRIYWQVDTSVGSDLQIGISFSSSAGIPADSTIKKTINVKSTIDSTTLDLKGSLLFNHDLYVYLWLKKNDGKWINPTQLSTDTVIIPPFVWQSVSYTFDLDGDTTVWANGRIRFITPPVGKENYVITSSVKVRVFTPTGSAYSGFIVTGSSLSFSKTPPSGPLYIYFTCSDIPPKYSLRDVRVYRYSGKKWLVDRTTQFDTATSSVFIKTNDFDMPFATLIDTMPPVIKVMNHIKDVVEKGALLSDTILVSDNTGNMLWNFQFTNGGNPFSSGDTTQKKILTEGSDSAIVSMQGNLVGEENGVRARLLADDGHLVSYKDLSRRVIRRQSDFFLTKEMKWAPLRVTAVLDTPEAKRLLHLVDTSASEPMYDQKFMRLFRWNPDESNAFKDDKWVEYTEVPDSIFDFTSGRLFWIKTRNQAQFNFGRAVTMSLRDTVVLKLNPKGWTDFAVPFRFDVMVGDLIAATRSHEPLVDSLQIYQWTSDSTGSFHLSNFYIPTMHEAGFDILSRPLSCRDEAGFSVYNPLNKSITLRIPPTPESMSSYNQVAKRKAGQGWVVRVIPRNESGAEFASVYCGYEPGAGATGSWYYPLLPKLEGPEIGVFDEKTGIVHGSVTAHDMKGGGCAYLLSFSNDQKSDRTIRLGIESTGSLDSKTMVALFDQTSGTLTTADDGKDFSVHVEGQGREYRWLLVGDENYLSTSVKLRTAGRLSFANIYPNPVRGMVNLHYTIPFARVGRVAFAIFDIKGRVIWSTSIREHGIIGGTRDCRWYGTTSAGRRASAGVYLVRLTAYDFKESVIGAFEKKITILK